MVPLCCCFSWLLFAWKVGESLFYLWCHSFFNGEGGGNVLSNLTFPPRRVHILILMLISIIILIATKCGFEFDPFSLKRMLRASRILPKLERAGGGGDCFRFFIFSLKNDRGEIGLLNSVRFLRNRWEV